MSKYGRFKKLRKYFQILVSLVLVILIVHWINFDQFITAIQNLNYWFLGLAFIVFTLDRVVMAVKWNLLLKDKAIKISWYQAIKIYYISNLLGFILPATLGTDMVKTYLIKKKGHSATDVMASILVERFLGFIGLFTFAFIGIFLLFYMFTEQATNFHQFFLTSGIIFILGTVVFLVSFNERTINFIISLLDRKRNKKIWGGISAKIQRLLLSYLSYKKKKRTLLVFYVLTLVEIFLGVFINFVVAEGLGLTVPLVYFLAYIPILMLLVRIPISFGGFGISEGAAIYFLGLVGVPTALGFSVGVITHFILLVGLLPGAVFYAISKDTKIEKDQLVTENELV